MRARYELRMQSKLGENSFTTLTKCDTLDPTNEDKIFTTFKKKKRFPGPSPNPNPTTVARRIYEQLLVDIETLTYFVATRDFRTPTCVNKFSKFIARCEGCVSRKDGTRREVDRINCRVCTDARHESEMVNSVS